MIERLRAVIRRQHQELFYGEPIEYEPIELKRSVDSITQRDPSVKVRELKPPKIEIVEVEGGQRARTAD